jgi:hypothetical protein
MGHVRSLNLLQINELIEEVTRETLDIPRILKLFRELFEDLVASTTASKCVEIDNFCTALYCSEEYDQLRFRDQWPDALHEIIFDCMTLHDYPSEFCNAQPQELLDMINDLCEELMLTCRPSRQSRKESSSYMKMAGT